MEHFHVIVLHGLEHRTVAKVSTLKKARSIAKSLLYEHLFKEVSIWRHESKFVEAHYLGSEFGDDLLFLL